jgi:non-ribosomal peptide synthase protein (TIGR01720 family)
MRAVFMYCGADRPGRLFLVIHHLVADATSANIVLEDLQTAYNQLLSDGQMRLPYKTSSILEVANKALEIANSGVLEGEIGYWKSCPWDQVKNLPTDYPRTILNNRVSSDRYVIASLDAEETRCLLSDLPKKTGAQFLDALLMSLMKSVTSWSGREWLQTIFLDSARAFFSTNYDMDLSRTAGWITLSPPIFIKNLHAKDPIEELKMTRAQLKNIPNGGLGYELIYWLGSSQKIKESIPSIRDDDKIVFNYLGMLGSNGYDLKSLLKPANENHGRYQNELNIRTYMFQCNAYVRKDVFSIQWHYSKDLHKESTVETLVNNFINCLRTICLHLE